MLAYEAGVDAVDDRQDGEIDIETGPAGVAGGPYLNAGFEHRTYGVVLSGANRHGLPLERNGNGGKRMICWK